MKIGRHARAGLATLALAGAACLEVEDTGFFPRGDFYVDGDVLVFLDQESRYYAEPDLNGDGDWDDDVVQVYSISDGTTRNLGLASFPSRKSNSANFGSGFVPRQNAEGFVGSIDFRLTHCL